VTAHFEVERADLYLLQCAVIVRFGGATRRDNGQMTAAPGVWPDLT
jgi:hypothetical protein